ncbi:hypothetical protein [Psychroserpens luteus]|uniref:Uncharacterized protein n=1 Tax=Psychroserpens luteus TaxID=1434066 RepID=A0ABW5ZZ40_9FLAO|nr:hypothetical protein [Psychroserpens luteus]|tara:strand:+ start:156 stop:338 length:183 start_codon:yes stop_codon:yes gene_type:complete
MKKTIIFSFSVILVSVMAILFIDNSNDHEECSQVKETKTFANGATAITTETHICKEEFNL